MCYGGWGVLEFLVFFGVRFIDFYLEVVEGVFVDVFYLVYQFYGEVGQSFDVGFVYFVVGGVVEVRGGYVGVVDGFDFFQLFESIFVDDLDGG